MLKNTTITQIIFDNGEFIMEKEIIIIIQCVVMLFIPLIIYAVLNKEKIGFAKWIGLTWLELFLV